MSVLLGIVSNVQASVAAVDTLDAVDDVMETPGEPANALFVLVQIFIVEIISITNLYIKNMIAKNSFYINIWRCPS